MSTCNRCGAERALDDNFCRRCGRQFTVNLPAVRETKLPVRAQTVPPSLVGSVAVLAVGTGLEWLARRFGGSAARAAGRALVNQARPSAGSTTRAPQPDAVDEFVFIRKVRFRR
jgi:hypothetical protein